MADSKLFELWSQQVPLIWHQHGTFQDQSKIPTPAGILSGSFNPLHSGHRELLSAAEQFLSGQVVYELSLSNADKPPLDYQTVEDRCQQFSAEPLALTRAATFVEKAELFPNTVFVVGMDTAVRIIDAQFYSGNRSLMENSLEQVRLFGCRFLVAGRATDQKFQTREHLKCPLGFESLFLELPESTFRSDTSSTHIRKNQSL